MQPLKLRYRQSLAVPMAAVAILSLAAATSSARASSAPSPALHKVKVLTDVRVRMRDGVELAVRITRPETEGKYPAILGYNPYRWLTRFKPAPSEREYSPPFH